MHQLAKHLSTIAASVALASSICASAAAQSRGLVVRYTSGGALDSTFSGDGLSVSGGTTNTIGRGVVVNGTSPGKINVVGAIASATGSWQQLLGRYNDDGTADTTFGWLGAATADFPGSTSELVMAVTTQAGATSKLVVAVQGNDSVGRGWLVERFNGNGTLDGTFGIGGFSAMNFTDADLATPHAIANAGLGRIVVAGVVSKVLATQDGDFGVARYMNDGTLDPSFGTGGLRRIHMSQIDEARGVAVYGSGAHTNKIVVAGWTLVGSESRMTAVRLNENGSLDSSFGGGDGIATIDFPGNVSSGAMAVAIGAGSDKLVMAGSIFDPATTLSSIAVARLKADGTLDTTFSADGMVTTTFPPAPSTVVANSVALMSDGRIVVAGMAQSSALEQVAVARYMPNGDLDASFDGDGRALTNLSPDGGIARALTLNGAGKPVIAGDMIDH